MYNLFKHTEKRIIFFLSVSSFPVYEYKEHIYQDFNVVTRDDIISKCVDKKPS